MSSLSHPHPHPRLPLECLQSIIQHIADKKDLLTLTTLLRVNRYICEATLPFLYNDPFKDSYHVRDVTRRRLAQTLLRQAPPERISDLVRAAIMDWPVEGDETNKSVQPSTPMPKQPLTNHDDKSKKAYPPPVVNYLSHIRHLDLNCLETYYAYCDCPESHDIPAHIEKYMDDHNLADELHHKSIDCLSHPSDAPMHVVYDLQELIKSDLHWALCNPDQVQSLHILLPHIKRYLDSVQVFKALSSIVFEIYEGMEVSSELLSSMSTKDQAHAKQIQQEALSSAQDMVRFIEKHTSLHKGVLQLIDCPLRFDTLGSSLLTEDLRSRLFQCLPPLLNPQHLDSRNWRQLAARFEDTNLKCVESIKSPWDWRSDLGPFADTFLRRCRSLKSLDWFVDRNDTFQWAVDERRQHDADLAKGLVPKPLVPLRTIDIRRKGINPSRVIDDAAFAFGDTLEFLKVYGNYPNGNGVGQSPQLRFGQGWHLPQLSLLESYPRIGTLHIAPEALVDCRSLVTLYLRDNLMEYDHHQVQSWLPSEHPFLKEIVLTGTPALSFHPDTLHTTPNLNNLSLSMRYPGGYHYIPPAEELEAEPDNNNNSNNNNNVDGAQGQEDQPSTYPSRPRWTWDWHLPNLTKLNLNADFAYRFQFRMLQKCPRLEELTLNTSTNTGTHGRVVTLHDLSSGNGYLKLPHLKYFHIFGAWHLENEVLRVLFHEIAPNIRDLHMKDCIGFDLKGWIEAISGLRQLMDSYCSLDVTEQQLKDVGLESSGEPHVQDQENTHITRLCFSDVYLRNVRRFPVV